MGFRLLNQSRVTYRLLRGTGTIIGLAEAIFKSRIKKLTSLCPMHG